MGSNMQRQAVPLLRPERPLVGTGLESQVARDSGMVPITKVNGTVSYVDANEIIVKDDDGNEHFHYLQKYQRSNQDTCLNQRPIVKIGDRVISGQVLADGSACEGGEIALGQNVLIAYMPWEGYNYEDAIRSRGLGDVYKRQEPMRALFASSCSKKGISEVATEIT